MPDYSMLDDRELLANDPPDNAKTTELISRYMKTVLAAARKFSESYNCADYEDFVSDGMDGLLAAIRGYNEDKGNFSAYVSVCIANRLRNTVKKALRRSSNLYEVQQEELLDIADPAPTPEEALIAKENSEAVFRGIYSVLSPLEQKCITASAMGLSYGEIAERLNTDVKAVDNALTRARAKLRKFFAG